ncbi:MAG: ATP-grasp domain-containing protein [Chlorobia bacterium]|nr:ATP-grasp domain-containing protein [Fimbriimonadaceae bacterium]
MRVLLLAQWEWQGPARIPKALRNAGCEVAAICKKGDWTSLSSFVDRFYHVDTNDEGAILSTLDRAIREWNPEIILPGTDNMVSTLTKYRLAVTSGPTDLPPNLLDLADHALANKIKERYIGGKIDLLNELEARGVTIAPQQELFTLGDANEFVQEHGYPVVLKPDVGFAGQGIKFCFDEQQLLRELNLILKAVPRVRYAIQKHLGRQTALIEFAARDGKMLAANSVYRLRTHPGDTGPTSVARIVKGSSMQAAAEKLCEFLGYNGFGVAQFMVESETCEPAYLIELNPRMSSFIHLWRLIGTDLVAALCNATRGDRYAIEPLKEGLTIALYPQEALRDRNSEFLDGLRDRVDDDPELAAEFERLIEKRWSGVPT